MSTTLSTHIYSYPSGLRREPVVSAFQPETTGSLRVIYLEDIVI